MANKKKRKRARNRAPAGGAPDSDPVPSADAPPRGGAKPKRRTNKERARAARETERKRQQRTASLRRAAIFGLVGIALVGVVWWTQRAASARPVPASATAAANAAGCEPLQTPSGNAPGGLHLQPGESHTYQQHPATSGYHDPTPLPTSPDVYTSQQPETQAVHFLEHAGVILYYRSGGPHALPQDVIDRLAGVARAQQNTLLMPYGDLAEGTSLALTAWNKLWECPSSITADQAATVANGFVHAFVCTSNAPEPTVSPDC